MRHHTILIPLLLCLGNSQAARAGKKHLFILSGQSNMARLRPETTFVPAIEKEFGKENVIIVKQAKGGRPIRMWLKKWEPPAGARSGRSKSGKSDKNGVGSLYPILLSTIRKGIEGKEIQTVTFLWMQGETDAFQRLSSIYKKSFLTLLKQLQDDLGREDINFVIGRLSDYDKKEREEWNAIRKIQMELADKSPRGAWVNTDDCNDGAGKGGKQAKNDLHYTKDGYALFGKRLAEKAIELVRKSGK